MPPTAPDEGHEDDATPTPPTAGWVRVLLVLAAVVSLLFVGAAVGLLIGQSGTSQTSTPAPDSVDVGFLQDMTVHHRQAILMAGLARDHSVDPLVKNLAFDIETSQIEQVGRMQGLLNLWGRDALPFGGYMGWMQGVTHDHAAPAGDGKVTAMPGMADQDEIKRLQQASGRELDVLFLQLMLRHHQGGIEMLRYAAEHAEVGVVRNLARQMATAQTSENDLLTAMITQRGGTPLPSPN
jgi:uncharacterized protein (DUF305 family)